MTKKQRWHAATGVGSAALLLVVLVAWAATAIFSGSDSTSGLPAVLRQAKRGPDLSWGSRCGLAHGSQDPIVGPPNATWQLVGHVAAPSNPGVGPAVADGLDRSCYQHSPAGALFAAANLLALGSLPNVIPRQQALDHFAPGHLRDVYGSQPPVPNHAQTVTIVGFQDDVLDRDSVNIRLALRVNGVLGYASLPMRWTEPNGDWRAELLSVQEPFDAGRLDSLADYIPWAA